jgi:hypothetical protein
MPFKPRGTDNTDLASLLTVLNNTHLMQRDNPLYQFCAELLKRVGKFQGDIADQVKTNTTAIDTITGGGGGGGTPITPGADVNSDFLTWSDESSSLPNSRNLVAGTGVSFDDTVANIRTINVPGMAYYDSPLTDGDVLETDLIFAAGDCIIVQVPF